MKIKWKYVVLAGILTTALLICVALWQEGTRIADTVIRNELALMQMQNTSDSSIAYEAYRNTANLAQLWPVYCIGTMALAALLSFLVLKKKPTAHEADN